MDCRLGCGACCIAPSISSPLPGLPLGKAAGVRCRHLTEASLCALFDSPERPQVCHAFKADALVCGSSHDEAMQILVRLEQETA
ncbi:YkgJ family cysteine cluster protein [Stutzerimonas tarimensis]|uniref:YkgJ family cysteine cluster protein n=1 Tax=Stutzerimonas tarimensis TaxID=1507735 RepID=A0ABV7T6W5_9GAMM